MTRLAVAAVVVLALRAPATAEFNFDPEAVYRVPLGNAPITGPVDAPITIVAWSDFACGYCYRAQFTLEAVERMFPRQLRWVHRTLPLDDDFTLPAEAMLAAAAQGRLIPMSERLYAAGGRVDRPAVEQIARELGLDLVRFRGELDSRAHRPQIEADVRDAVALGVSGTPTYFINGRAVHGNQPLKVFVEVIEQELVRAAKTPGGYSALVAGGASAANLAAKPVLATKLDDHAIYRVGLGLPGHQLGPDSAPVTVVVWGDFECPYCAKFAGTLRELRTKYRDDLRIVFRHLAMRGHRGASLAAEAAIAAANQGKFWEFHDRLFDRRGSITRADLEQFTRDLGLDLERMRAVLDDRRFRELVASEGAAAEALGVDGTPTMFIDGQPVEGMRDLATMSTLIDDHLARARSALTKGVSARDLYALAIAAATGAEWADPTRVPQVGAVHITLREDDRVRAVAAACRRNDAVRARDVAAPLSPVGRERAASVCVAFGIDL